jgi:hypothetical protein
LVTKLSLAMAAATLATPCAADDAKGAEALFEEGRRALDQGNDVVACQKFAASQALQPAVGTLLNLGTCEQRLDRLATARAYYREAAALARSRDDQQREHYATERAEELEHKSAHLIVRVTEPAPGMEVRRDGHVIEAAAWGTPIAVDVGTHLVEGSAPRRSPFRRDVEVIRDGDLLIVDVPALASQGAVSAGAPAAAPPTGTATTVRKGGGGLGTQRVLALVAVGAGIGGLAVATLLGLHAQSEWNSAKPDCDPDGVCGPTGYPIAQNARRDGNWATVAAALGGVAVAGGVVLWFTAPGGGSVAAGVGPTGGAGTGALWHVEGRF